MVLETLKQTCFTDVVLKPVVIDTLKSVILRPLLPRHFNTGFLPTNLCLVYFCIPPGTGETMVCRALAHEFGIPMLLVKPSNIFDMYVGESMKHVQAAFVSLGTIPLPVFEVHFSGSRSPPCSLHRESRMKAVYSGFQSSANSLTNWMTGIRSTVDRSGVITL